MKAVFLKTSALLLACLPAVASPGQDKGTDLATGYDRNNPQHLAVTKLPQKAPGNIDISWDVVMPDNLTVDWWYVYSVEDPWFRWSDFNAASEGCSLPPGHYFFYFQATDYQNDLSKYVYISRTIDITEETHFTFDLNDCTHRIKTEVMLPDGTEAKADTYRSSLGGYDTDGTVSSYRNKIVLMRRSGGLIMGFTSNMYYRAEDKGQEFGMQEYFYVNKPEGEYDVVLQSELVRKSNDERIVCFHAMPMEDLDEETILEVPSDRYVRLDAKYGELADIPSKYEDAQRRQRHTLFTMQNGRILDWEGGGSTSSPGSACSSICVYVGNSTLPSVEPLISYGEVQAQEPDQVSGDPGFQPVSSPHVTFTDGKVIYNAYAADDLFKNSEHMQLEGGPQFFLDFPFVSHPRFSWEYNPEKVPVFGNSTPVLSISTAWRPGAKGFSFLRAGYYGRLGEFRTPDLYGSYAEVEIDGDKVFAGSVNELTEWAASEFSLPKAKGNYTFTIEDDCATVDGMPSLNRTVIKCDASNSDREAPTLTWLNFRDKADEITDRFETAADGTLEFSAADLSSQVNAQNNAWFKCASPLSVKVEYAAEGSGDFSPLPFEEVPEMFFSPYFGSFYRAPLSGVTKGSATGWFKLRITITDEAGNSQEQTLTPVFYIAESASVDHVETGPAPLFDGGTITSDGAISVYDLQGRLVGSGNYRLDTAGLSGMYIVRANGRSVKITI